MRKLISIAILALLAAGTASAQSIAIPRSRADSRVLQDGFATVNTLASGERWVILNSGDGFGIQITPLMPVSPSGYFQTNIVVNLPDGGDGPVRSGVNRGRLQS